MASTAKNTFYLLSAYIYQKLISLFYFILLARYLGADNFGKYTFALSFAALFSVLIDLGLFLVLTREIARDKSKTKEYFSNILGFNIVAGLSVLVLIYIVINALGYPVVTKGLVYFSAIIILLDTIALSFYYTFRGHLNMKYESLGIILHKTILLLAGIVLIYLKAQVVLMLLPLLIASCFYLSNAIFFLKRKLGLWPIPRFNKKTLRSLLKISWPFFIAAVFAKLYATSDTILLSYMVGDRSVGWYNAAMKLVNAFLLLIAGSLSSALYPSLSYYFVRSKQELSSLFTKSVFYLMLVTIPLMTGFLILAKPIILFIYGTEYLSAAIILTFLTFSIPFMFLDFIISALLNACEKQKINTLIHGIGVFVFIGLNLILIPMFAHLGAAGAVLGGFSILFILEVYLTRKLVRLDKGYLLNRISLIILNSLIMGAVLFLIKDRVHILFSVVFGILAYFGFSYVFGLVQKKEILFLKSMLRFKQPSSLLVQPKDQTLERE
ncbi:flippase [Patescibacteria group bacterium]|nr:flippase [Patescibacteria group bacterium]